MTKTSPAKLEAREVSVRYGDMLAVKQVSIAFHSGEVTALIGPSGSGKSSFLRCLNRLNDTISGCSVSGHIVLDGEDIYGPALDVEYLRARVGMVFEKPAPFARSIYDNVAYGLRLHGLAETPDALDERVALALQQASLWEQVKDRLDRPGASLSLGEQQRLCIARAAAIEPDVILMDEPCGLLDPIETAKIESLIEDLKDRCAVAIVTHSMQQAARISQKTAHFQGGVLIEQGETTQIFTSPRDPRTRDYITGRFGYPDPHIQA